MRLEHSLHWKQKRFIRKEITDDIIEYALYHSSVMRDKKWPDALNAICRIPSVGRTIKIVYRSSGKETFIIITAYWLD